VRFDAPLLFARDGLGSGEELGNSSASIGARQTVIELVASFQAWRSFSLWPWHTSYGKNIHPASVRGLKGLGVRYLRPDWIHNHQPFLCGSLTQAGVRTDKVLGQAPARHI